MDEKEAQALHDAITSLEKVRLKVGLDVDSFPAYYCPRCKNTIEDGVGAVLIENGDDVLGFCKFCFVSMLKQHCGVIQFAVEYPTDPDKNTDKQTLAGPNTEKEGE